MAFNVTKNQSRQGANYMSETKAIETSVNRKPIVSGQVSDNAIEGIKWTAILFMTIDHINSLLIHRTTGQFYSELFSVGRIAFPLFAFVLAYNLARPRSAQGEKKAIAGAFSRLLLFGAISIVPYFIATGGSILPMNIMFTLALATGIIYVIHLGTECKKRTSRYAVYFLAHLIFIVISPLVDYSLYGVSLIVMAWLFFRYSSTLSLVLTCILAFSLFYVNGNHWGLIALPIFGLSYFIDVKIPRTSQLVYYIYYPAHLAVIAALIAVYGLYF